VAAKAGLLAAEPLSPKMPARKATKEPRAAPTPPSRTAAPAAVIALLLAVLLAWARSSLPSPSARAPAPAAGNNSSSNDDRWLADGSFNFETTFCNIKRVGKVSRREFVMKVMGKVPAILTIDDDANLELVRRTARARILSELGDRRVVISAQNSYSTERIKTTVREYFEKYLPEQESAASSNTTYYFFGENFDAHWEELNEHYVRPDLPSAEKRHTALSFGIGGRGSGVAFHFHGPAMVEQFHGRKRWFLYPHDKKPHFNPDLTQGQWLNTEYKALGEEERPLECTLKRGELLYFPTHWYHSTLNLDEHTAFMACFTKEDHIDSAHIDEAAEEPEGYRGAGT